MIWKILENVFFENLCVKFMCEMYGGVGGQDGLEHGIDVFLLIYIIYV